MSDYVEWMGERDAEAPSALRLVGMLFALVLVLGGVVVAVVFSAGAAVNCSLEPKTTSEGSVCKPLSGDCVRLSRSAIETKFSVRPPTGARLEASGSKSMIKASEAWAVACVPDVTALLQDAEGAGFVESPVSDYPERHDWSGKGPVSREVRLTAPAQGVRRLDVGGSCDRGTWVYLGFFLDK
ncbi:hypothetical protein HUN58_02155 [Curtobacterium sp. Csp1]|uniref:hypothetical protein n=1 Tax=Curtobacterium sp. Csp1 TaxID=2495429 RepID=UPI00159A7055|nr:hypothetical protein [Curtobacterium sp. Csp1]QKS18862.1 hypothetical protein HUN58_02155 [Curtobacterium sp. Csp1]